MRIFLLRFKAEELAKNFDPVRLIDWENKEAYKDGMANRVVHFEIEVSDMTRASDFYHKAFGWDMQKQGEEYGGYVLALSGPAMPSADPKLQGINGGLWQSPKKEINAYRCVIGVDEIDKAIADVKAAGGKVYDDNKAPDGSALGEKMDIPKVGIFAKCEDTEGNVFTLLQPDLSMMEKEPSM